ncbi:carbohydrate porin [Colwellia demingiae]|uniref:Carbohydrate porin n=1 Tax=Colwellia demingiae TaxID=89401 RepID=A0A5C6QBW6_9GAMM|nr:carbohydrate porin [Colwellia demingiae]TWX66339.1 carbohydrate porin [Colwellia demingiae]
MFSHKKLLTLAISGLLVTTNSLAKEDDKANFGSSDAVGNKIANDNKKSKPTFKTQLEQHGIEIGADYFATFMTANKALPTKEDSASSGLVRFYGSWTAMSDEKNNRGSLIWKVEHRHSYTDNTVKDFEFDVGGLGLIGPTFSDEGARLTNLYWKQEFMDGNATVVGGFLDVTDFVDLYAMTSPWSGFMNFAFSTGTTTIALPGDATLGMAGGVMLSDQYYLIGSFADMNSISSKPFKGFESFFSDNKYFKSVEFGWAKSRGELFVDNIHATLWHSDESEIQGSTEGYGINFSASRLINSTWYPFIRAGISEDAGTLMEKSVSAGIGYYGLGGESNNLGLAVNWGDIKGSDDQYTTELFYFMQITSNFELTADIQYIANPALNLAEKSALIYGLRLRLDI